MRPLRVLHLPTNIRWIMDVIIEGQNEIGIETQKFILCNELLWGPLRDPNNPKRGWPIFIRQLLHFMRVYIKALLWADVIHWQYATRFWPEHSFMRSWDFKIINFLKKPSVAQFHGLDFMRNYEWAKENPWWLEAFSEESFEEFEHVGKIAQRDFVDAGFILIMGHGMLPAVLPKNEKRAMLLERSVDVAVLCPQINEYEESRAIVIIHGPSSPQKKGTKYVKSAVEKLSKIRDINYIELQNMDHDEVVERLGEGDIVVDQLLCGDYGLASVEALARGNAVVANICDTVKSSYPDDLPIVSATPETIFDVLLDLVDDHAKRIDLAKCGYEYAYRVHSKEATMPEILQAYRKAAVEKGRRRVVKKIDAALEKCKSHKWR